MSDRPLRRRTVLRTTLRTALPAASASAATALAGCPALPTGGSDHDETPRTTPTTDMRFIAHRGCMAQYPENTLKAMRESAPAVDAIEVDVRRCGSGELVLFHDERLDDLTDATGRVSETPYEQLREVDVLGSGEHVPLLADALETVPADVGLNLELKDGGIASDVVSMADRYDHEVFVSSFDAAELGAAGDAGADSLAYLFSDDPTAGLDVAADLDCEYVHPHHRLCTRGSFVATAHDRGFEVNAWTVETRTTLSELRTAGVDGAIVDDCRFAD